MSSFAASKFARVNLTIGEPNKPPKTEKVRLLLTGEPRCEGSGMVVEWERCKELKYFLKHF